MRATSQRYRLRCVAYSSRAVRKVEMCCVFLACSAKETHQLAEANQAKNAQLRSAFGISEFYVDGSALDPNRRAKEDAARATALAKKGYRSVSAARPLQGHAGLETCETVGLHNGSVTGVVVRCIFYIVQSFSISEPCEKHVRYKSMNDDLLYKITMQFSWLQSESCTFLRPIGCVPTTNMYHPI